MPPSPAPEQTAAAPALAQWIRRHPWRALAALALVLLELAAGALLGGVLTGGLLGGGWSGRTLAGAAVAGLLMAGLRARQQIAAALGPRELARRWGRRLAGFALAVVLLLGGTALVQLHTLAILPPLSQDRVAAFERLWQAIEMHYPYFAQKGVDWTEVYRRYQPRVVAARNDAEYFQVLREMLAELQDSHTGLVAPRPPAHEKWLAMVEEIEGQAVVTRVARDVRLPGLAPGAVILARDGQPVAEYLAGLPPCQTVGSTPRQRRQQAYARTLVVPLETDVTFLYEDVTGALQKVTVRWPAEPAPGAAGTGASGRGGSGATGGSGTGDPGPGPPLVTGRRLPSGVGVIRIPTFSGGTGHDLVAEFDAALDALLDAPGLILDLRGNGGGNAALANAMAGRLVERTLPFGYELTRQPLPLRGWARRYEHRLRPRGQAYTGPVALLIDTSNLSTAETFIVSLRDTGRALTVGRPTAGGSGSPVTVRLPGGGRARYSIADFRRLDGRSLEGHGIEPDILVPRRIADVRAGHDRDLAAAEQALLKGAAGGTP